MTDEKTADAMRLARLDRADQGVTPAPADVNQEALREAHRAGLRELREAHERQKAAVKRKTLPIGAPRTPEETR